jgi:hypothetical protein
MMQTITASVGRLGGANRPGDVKTVQELLNRVPSAAGGPYPLLAVDAVCGPRTVDAIQKFQVRQLGRGKADGRVDPIGPTLQKLNELGGGAGKDQARVLSSESILKCPHGASVQVLLQGARPLAPSGMPALRASDDFVVMGCLNPICCERVNWIIASDPLVETNIGICVSGSGVPLGKLRIASA